MNPTLHTAGKIAPPTHGAEQDSLMDWMLVLWRGKKLLLAATLLCGGAGLVLAFLIPNIYQSETRILPPQHNTGAAALLGQLGSGATLASGALGIGNSNDMYLGILRSRTVADALIKRFDLKRLYGTELTEIARAKLAERTTLRAGKDGIISIAFRDPDPQLAQRLANAYVAELSEVSAALAMTDAARHRLFFERELAAAKNKLADTEMALRGVLGANGVVSVDSQSAALVATAARLRGLISRKEVELGAMQAFVTARSEQYRRASAALRSLRAELARLEGGGQARQASPVPASAMASLKMLREFKHYQMLYELLSKQYESARLAEMRDPATVQVIDSAVLPENKSQPRRALIVLLAAFSGLCIAAGALGFSEVMRRYEITRRGASSERFGVA